MQVRAALLPLVLGLALSGCTGDKSDDSGGPSGDGGDGGDGGATDDTGDTDEPLVDEDPDGFLSYVDCNDNDSQTYPDSAAPLAAARLFRPR